MMPRTVGAIGRKPRIGARSGGRSGACPRAKLGSTGAHAHLGPRVSAAGVVRSCTVARHNALAADRRPKLDPYGDPTITTARAPRGAWPLARFLGADVYLHWSMVLIPFTLVTVIAASPVGAHEGDALLWTALWSAVATAVIWTHCYAHLWTSGAIAAGAGVILLTPFAPLTHDAGRRHGTSPQAAWGHDPRQELRSALAGPASHAFWFVIALVVSKNVAWHSTGGQMLHQFMLINVALWAANLLPFHPMDGGRILRAALTPSIGAARAEAWTASAGYGGAVSLGFGGLALLRTGNPEIAPWAVFAVAVGVLTLTASQRALFAAQFRAHSALLAETHDADAHEAEPRADRATATTDIVPDFLDEQALARLVRDSTPNETPTGQAVESDEERRRRLQDRIDALLDRINEVGGLAGLTPDERHELAEASAMLRRETAEG